MRWCSGFDSSSTRVGSMFHFASFVLFPLVLIMKSDLFVGLMQGQGKSWPNLSILRDCTKCEGESNNSAASDLDIGPASRNKNRSVWM